jgi:hypothetical protein
MRIGIRSRARRRLMMIAATVIVGASGITINGLTAADAATSSNIFAPIKINSTEAQGKATFAYLCGPDYGLGYVCSMQIDVRRKGKIDIVNTRPVDTRGINTLTIDLLPGCYDYRTGSDIYIPPARGQKKHEQDLTKQKLD